MPSFAEQDYIKSIYTLQQTSRNVSTSALAQKLGITAASVSGMLRKLSEARLVTYRRYQGVRLTKRGRRLAVDIMRRHRLIELFLVEALAMPSEKVHHEAEVLEHVISDDVLERIDKWLGYPDRDPHGAPIPSSSGERAEQPTITLDQIEQGGKGVIAEVPDYDPGLLRHLSRLGLVPGTRFRIREVLAVDGTRVLQCGRKEVNVSSGVSKTIRVIWEQQRDAARHGD